MGDEWIHGSDLLPSVKYILATALGSWVVPGGGGSGIRHLVSFKVRFLAVTSAGLTSPQLSSCKGKHQGMSKDWHGMSGLAFGWNGRKDRVW